jgi:MerR family mercuric resistance operon transcriptional regulator
MQTFTIGKVARQAGVGIETVRFYEREGLIPEPVRSASGYRQYPAATVARIRFIRRAKALGFSLREVRELLSLRLDPARSSAEAKAHAEAKIADIEQKIQTLRRMKQTLVDLTEACDGCGPGSDCPILDALDAHDVERD